MEKSSKLNWKKSKYFPNNQEFTINHYEQVAKRGELVNNSVDAIKNILKKENIDSDGDEVADLLKDEVGDTCRNSSVNVIENIVIKKENIDSGEDEVSDVVEDETRDTYRNFVKNDKTQNLGKETSSGIEKRAHKCSLCSKCFKLKHHLAQHTLTHTKGRALMPRSHNCPICDKQFKMKHHLLRHMFHHNQVKMFNCFHCEKSYIAKHDLQKHVATHHQNSKLMFTCGVCCENFDTRLKLLRHERLHNTLQCGVCGKIFTNQRNLKNHLRVHAKLVSFKCDVCDKMFPFRYFLLEHKRTHTGEKPFNCNECDKTFTTKSNQLRHLKSHCRIRTCQNCLNEFIDEKLFKLHLKTCKLKFVCEKCGLACKKLSNLKRHLKTHSKSNNPALYMSSETFSESDNIIVKLV